MKLTVNYTDGLGNKSIYTTFCNDKLYDIYEEMGIVRFINEDEEFSVKLDKLISFQYEEIEGKNKTTEGSYKIKVKAIQVTPDTYEKTVDQVFCEAVQEGIIRPGIGLDFIVSGVKKIANIGDYIIYKDGKFNVCNKDYFEKHYFC